MPERFLKAAIAVAWLWIVVLAYYTANWPYYREKIATFGGFLLRLAW